jgi:FAD/FMN-containing dehydrogenase
MSLAPSLLAQLVEGLGADGVRVGPEDCAAYETPLRHARGRAACVLRPASTAEVSAVLGLCVRERLPWLAQGGHTGLVLGGTPDASGETVLISLERLRQPLLVDAEDRSVRVGAGLRLSQLNAALAETGLWLPVELGADPCIGGLLATNAAGARFLRYGDLRRQVLALEVVCADAAGSVLELGRGLRKDNTGLDLKQLWVGSGGALGIITAATLELQPRPTARAVALVQPTVPAAALALLQRLEAACGPWLAAFEWMSGAVMRHALETHPALRNPFGATLPPEALLVELAGADEAALGATLETTLAAAMDAGEAAEVWCGDPAPAWALRHALSEGLRRRGRVLGLDLAFRRSRVLPFRAAAQALLSGHPGFELCDFGHLADGGLHANLLTDPAMPEERCTAVRRALLRLAVEDYGGSYSGEHGVGRANQADYDAWTPAAILARAGAVQRCFADHPGAGPRWSASASIPPATTGVPS